MSRNFFISTYYKIMTRSFRTIQWLLGASTVGVRTLVINDQGQVLLVKHTYMEGWHFPGGGVLRGESSQIAAIRELREESNVIALGTIEVVGVYFHTVMWANDYIVLYVVKEFTQMPVQLGGEIAEVQWFALENLPDDLSASTRRRIAEYCDHQPKSDQW
jgi:ADP-ribose pyrophosphatase YjhB (NUDIX family)